MSRKKKIKKSYEIISHYKIMKKKRFFMKKRKQNKIMNNLTP